MINYKKNITGIGLIETMVTFLILAGSIIALIEFQNSLGYNNLIVEQSNDGILLSLKQIETLRDFLTIQGSSNSYQAINTSSISVTGQTANYLQSWQVVDFTDPDYKRVDLSSAWQDNRGINQSVRLSTKIGEIDPAYSAAAMSKGAPL